MNQKRHSTTSEKRIAENRKLDYIQKLGMTPEQRKAWDRKPYGGTKNK